ncbi:MAG TPA: hypothetical protein PKW07_05985 [Syntrophorhabdaceae bacterium]|nr:hypothetical protein [Syntrophorhabdaceae bacterium]
MDVLSYENKKATVKALVYINLLFGMYFIQNMEISCETITGER